MTSIHRRSPEQEHYCISCLSLALVDAVGAAAADAVAAVVAPAARTFLARFPTGSFAAGVGVTATPPRAPVSSLTGPSTYASNS